MQMYSSYRVDGLNLPVPTLLLSSLELLILQSIQFS